MLIDDEIYIPRNISIIVVLSSHLFLINSIFCIFYKQYAFAFILFAVYVTSILYWTNVKYGPYKIIDSVLAVSAVIAALFSASSFTPRSRIIFLSAIAIMITAWTINDRIFYYQVMKHREKIEHRHFDDSYSWFSLEYTNPNTKERDWACYRSVCAHSLFVHILPTVTYMCCI